MMVKARELVMDNKDEPSARELAIFNAYVGEEHWDLFDFEDGTWAMDIEDKYVNVGVYVDDISVWRWYDKKYLDLLIEKVGGGPMIGDSAIGDRYGHIWCYDILLSDPDGIEKFKRAIDTLSKLDWECEG